MIDWNLATWLATRLAGEGDAAPPAAIATLQATALDAQRRVIAYTGLEPSRPLPAPEAIDRAEWVRANVATMRRMLDPVLASAQRRVDARRPSTAGTSAADSALTRMGRSLAPAVAALAVNVAVTAEVAVVLGFLAGRVLGQYELVLLDEGPEATPPRLLFVGPNLGAAVDSLDAPQDEFLTWVTLHEVTHAVQFGGVPWLQGHLAGLLSQLLHSAELRIDAPRRVRLPSRATLERSLRALRAGDVVGIVTSPGERETLDRVQATMAVVEGHAEHVMDAVAPELLPSLPRLRAALDHRRATRTGVSRVLGKLLGLEMKLRQYEQGKYFCDEIVRLAGPEAIRRVFSAPESLPTLAELGEPAQWVRRVGLLAVGPAGDQAH